MTSPALALAGVQVVPICKLLTARHEIPPIPPDITKLRTVYSVQCTVYSVQCTVYSVQCTVYSVQCTVYSVQGFQWLHAIPQASLHYQSPGNHRESRSWKAGNYTCGRFEKQGMKKLKNFQKREFIK